MNNIYLSNFFSNDLNILYIAYSFIIVIFGNTPNNLFFNNISEEEIKLINDKMLINTYNFFLSNNTIKRKGKNNGIYYINVKIIKIYS